MSKRRVSAWCREHNVVVAGPVWVGGAMELAPEGHRPPAGMTDGYVASAHEADGRLRGYGYGRTRDEARADLVRRTEVHGPIP